MAEQLNRSDTVVDEKVNNMLNDGADTHAMFDLAGASVNPVVGKLIPDHPDSEVEGFNSIDVCEGAGTNEGVEGEEAFIIGRSKEISHDLRVDHPRLSNKHCKLLLEHVTGKVFLVDISTNGVFINDARVAKNEKILLSSADSIRFVNDKIGVSVDIGSNGQKVCTAFIYQQVKRTGNAILTPAAITKMTGDTMDVAGVAVRKIQAANIPKDPSAPAGLSNMEDDLTCSITLSLLYNPYMVLPCLHCFSGHAISKWIDQGKRACPECRGVISQVRPSHKVNNLLTKFIDQHKNTPGFQYYTDDEMAAMIGENTIPTGGKALKRSHVDDDEDYDDDDDEEYSDSDQDDDNYNGGGWIGHQNNQFSPGYTANFGFNGYNAGGGFGFGQFGSNNCPQCHTPSAVDGYKCNGLSAPHHTCKSCHIRFPNRPLSDIPQTCFMCSQPFCDAYLSAIPMPGVPTTATTTTTTSSGQAESADNDAPVPGVVSTISHAPYIPGGACRNEAGRKMFKMVKDHHMEDLPASLFSGNTIEQSILSTYLSNQGSIPNGSALNFHTPLGVMTNHYGTTPFTVPNVWRLCVVNLENGTWIPDLVSIKGPVKANSYVCRPCCQRIFAAQLYHYRRAISPGDLPNSIANRPSCWHGSKCRTQFHNHEHAQKYNHVCPQEKRKE